MPQYGFNAQANNCGNHERDSSSHHRSWRGQGLLNLRIADKPPQTFPVSVYYQVVAKRRLVMQDFASSVRRTNLAVNQEMKTED